MPKKNYGKFRQIVTERMESAVKGEIEKQEKFNENIRVSLGEVKREIQETKGEFLEQRKHYYDSVAKLYREIKIEFDRQQDHLDDFGRKIASHQQKIHDFMNIFEKQIFLKAEKKEIEHLQGVQKIEKKEILDKIHDLKKEFSNSHYTLKKDIHSGIETLFEEIHSVINIQNEERKKILDTLKSAFVEKSSIEKELKILKKDFFILQKKYEYLLTRIQRK